MSVRVSHEDTNDQQFYDGEDCESKAEAEKFQLNNQKESLESRVLVIYTGGTIGMIVNQDGGEWSIHW